MSGDTYPHAKVAAFFDLDGTLIPEPSLERRFFSELRRARAISILNYVRWSVEAMRLLPHGLVSVLHGNKRYLAGMSRDLAFGCLEPVCFFEEGIARVAWHVRQGHEIVLVSGTIEPLAQLAALALECELAACNLQARPWVLATKLAEHGGRWTGCIVGKAMFGPAKMRAAEQWATEKNLNLRECHAYGNSFLDRHLLCAVGHAHAVNPGKHLAALANERDWPIWHWFQEKQVTSTQNSGLAPGIPHIGEQA